MADTLEERARVNKEVDTVTAEAGLSLLFCRLCRWCDDTDDELVYRRVSRRAVFDVGIGVVVHFFSHAVSRLHHHSPNHEDKGVKLHKSAF